MKKNKSSTLQNYGKRFMNVFGIKINSKIIYFFICAIIIIVIYYTAIKSLNDQAINKKNEENGGQFEEENSMSRKNDGWVYSRREKLLHENLYFVDGIEFKLLWGFIVSILWITVSIVSYISIYTLLHHVTKNDRIKKMAVTILFAVFFVLYFLSIKYIRLFTLYNIVLIILLSVIILIATFQRLVSQIFIYLFIFSFFAWFGYFQLFKHLTFIDPRHVKAIYKEKVKSFLKENDIFDEEVVPTESSLFLMNEMLQKRTFPNLKEVKFSDVLEKKSLFDEKFTNSEDVNIEFDHVHEKDSMFYPKISRSIFIDPLSNKKEYYFSFSLEKFCRKKVDYLRKKVNVVLVLDISEESFNSLTYNHELKDNDFVFWKILSSLVKFVRRNINEDDSIGIVVFDNDKYYLAHSLKLMKDIQDIVLFTHILQDIKMVRSGNLNGKNDDQMEKKMETLEDAFLEASMLFYELEESKSSKYENRIIIITNDLVENENLFELMKLNEENRIYSTFFHLQGGIFKQNSTNDIDSMRSINFNFDKVIREFVSVKGTNYYQFHSLSLFERVFIGEFDVYGFPKGFNVHIKIYSDSPVFSKVVGSSTHVPIYVENEHGHFITEEVEIDFPFERFFASIFKSKTYFGNRFANNKVKGDFFVVKLGELFENNENKKFKVIVKYYDEFGRKRIVRTKFAFENDVNEKEMKGLKENCPCNVLVLYCKYISLMKRVMSEECNNVKLEHNLNIDVFSLDDVESNRCVGKKLEVSKSNVEKLKKFLLRMIKSEEDGNECLSELVGEVHTIESLTRKH